MNNINIVTKKVCELIPYANNPRKNDKAVKAVENSIKEFGFKVPMVIDKDNVIVAGHTRYTACKNLGIEDVPCVVADDLSDEQIKAFRLADNKVSEFAEWDFELLDSEIAEISDVDMNLFGFNLGDDDMSMFEDDAFEVGEEEDNTGVKPYRIVYEIVFNDESEQSEWHDFLKEIKDEYPYYSTISERILMAIREWRDKRGEC